MPDTASIGSGSRGFVFATTGPDYTTLARRAARTLSAVMPYTPIDLFTDQCVEDEVFARIHPLADSFFRPKIEALARSRFDRTVMLDADVVVLTDVSELFDILDRADLAGVPGVNRGPGHMRTQDALPRSHPLINTGVLAFRRTEALDDFARRWGTAMRESGDTRDQPSFRRLLWETRIPFASLPREYNMIQMLELYSWGGLMGAPRILHVRALSERPAGNPNRPFRLGEVLQPRLARHVSDLLKLDPLLLAGETRPVVKQPIVELLKAARPRSWRDRLAEALPTSLGRRLRTPSKSQRARG